MVSRSLQKLQLVENGQKRYLHSRTTTYTNFKARCELRTKDIFRGNLSIVQLEEGIVGIIQNLIEFALERILAEERLRQDVSIVVGFVPDHPEVFKAPNGGNYAS